MCIDYYDSQNNKKITDLPVFSTIYIGKESVKFKCKRAFNSWIIFNGVVRLIFYTFSVSRLKFSKIQKMWYHIYPTPPLGQDMTQG